VRTGGFELGRMNPRKLSTKDRERFGGTSRKVSRSPAFLGTDLDGEHESGGSSSASANGLAALELPRDPVIDEHWEVTIGESNKSPGLCTRETIPSSTLVMHSSASAGGPLSGCGLREDLSA